MAGFTHNHVTRRDFEFHTDTPHVAERIREANDNVRVITLQLDGDELDAALWGLANYQKGTKVTIKHDRDCPCVVEFCHIHPGLVKTGV